MPGTLPEGKQRSDNPRVDAPGLSTGNPWGAPLLSAPPAKSPRAGNPAHRTSSRSTREAQRPHFLKDGSS